MTEVNNEKLAALKEQIRLMPGATKLEKSVWLAISAIPCGEVRTYSEIAETAGYPRAVRAVASAVGRNPFPIIIPCHRVIRKNGDLGQYTGGGPSKKRELLLQEGIIFSSQNAVSRS